MSFELTSEFQPKSDQPEAIRQLVEGLNEENARRPSGRILRILGKTVEDMVRSIALSLCSAILLALSFIPMELSAQVTGHHKIRGMIHLDDSTSFSQLEVRVWEWLEFMNDGNHQQYPAKHSLAQVPYRHLFVRVSTDHSGGSEQVVLDMIIFGKFRYWTYQGRFGPVVTLVPTDSAKTKEQRRRIRKYLKYPITGISHDQALAFCHWRTSRHIHDTEGDDETSVRFGLPSIDVYERYLSSEDSTNMYCSLFNYSCADCNGNAGKIRPRNAFIQPGKELTPADGYAPDIRGFFNLRGNAAEMTQMPGIAKGGSYAHPAKDALPGSVQHYDRPEPWLGFRCVVITKRL